MEISMQTITSISKNKSSDINREPVIIIPVYQPERALIGIIEKLIKNTLSPIILVDDGSSIEHRQTFELASASKRVTLLTHNINQGKGAALKTAFHYFIEHFRQENPGVVTVDADGQHKTEDVMRVIASLKSHPDQMTLGSREFDEKVPFRSRFGNVMTKKIFELTIGHRISDTQTGLRAIPASLLQTLTQLSSNRYDFELEMLITAVGQKVTIQEIPIKTIYENNNESSHFNPLLDSFRVYFVFLRFATASIVATAIDYIVFMMAYLITGQIFLSESAARVVAGTYNFRFNKKMVFKSKSDWKNELLKYVTLVSILLLISYSLMISVINLYGFDVFWVKIIIAASLFIPSFYIQKLLVFKK
jgi:glycosyltransferase involved in cell wall biosynthesis